MNNELKKQVVEQLKSANNVLVAVSNNPTVDELSASIALTLLLNKLDKHATTVFSGIVPSTIEFLQPEKTIETTTDSLRDFIIALDKSKADKLRYKVEDDVVRIFITPYRTSITEKDLEFSQGDFNVDVVIALGVNRREDLDKAITAHGRILHDATIVALTAREKTSELGSMNWQEQQASSLCEMVASLAYDLGAESIDGQMATALLTGVIAETDRFRNEKTTPLALSLSSQLMTAGANQQLIADKLEAPAPVPDTPLPIEQIESSQNPDMPAQSYEEKPEPHHEIGELDIDHGDESKDENGVEKIHIDEHGNLGPQDTAPEEPQEEYTPPEQTYVSPETAGDGSEQGSQYQNQSMFNGTPAPDVVKTDDSNDQPTLKDANHNMPTMKHGLTLEPPVREGDLVKSDKPFDLQEAINTEATGNQGVQPEPPTPAQPVQNIQSDVAETTTPTPQPVPQPSDSQPIQDTLPMPQPVIPEAPQQQAPPSYPTPPSTTGSLADLEVAVGSPHVQQSSQPSNEGLDTMRDAVAKAADSQESPFPLPSQSLGAQSVDMNQPQPTTAPQPAVYDPNAAPPVPPPMTAPHFYDEDGKNDNLNLN